MRTARMSVLDRPRTSHGDHMTYEISHLRALESEAIHIIREVAAELEQPRAAVLRRQGLDRAAAPGREGVPPGALPFPVMHVDTGHNFPEVIEYRDRMVAELGERLIVAQRPGLDRQGPRDRGDRPARVAQPAADDDAARRDRGARLRRRVRRRAPRRGARPRQGAHLLASATTSGSGTRRTSGPSCGTSTTAASAAASTCACSRSRTGPSSTSGSTSREEEIELPSIYFAHEREVFERDGMLYAVSDFVELLPGEEPFDGVGPLPHRRRHDAAPAPCASTAATLDDGDRRDRRHARSPSAARRAPTTASPRRRWKTASARATSDGAATNGHPVGRRHVRAAPLRDRRLRRRRQVAR